ncbi:MAG: hypothetical protein IT165_06460 [Bryobacterales bacterium]|nr:hypothetical protein [Bryobacterales bacterium]
MAGISQINYSDALAGRINRRPDHNPMAAWFVAQGATYRGSSRFVDAELQLGDDHYRNLLLIIRSARNQGHDGVEIRLTQDSLAAIEARVAELSALEDAEVATSFFGEHQGREKVVITFRAAKANWLLELAQRELPKGEYEELRHLLVSRLTRSDRELLLTEKAIAASNQRRQV